MTAVIGTGVIALIGLMIALVLAGAARRFKGDTDSVITLINKSLPQTQCAQCGYPGCRPYAQAIAEGEAINRCPPGGDATIRALADLLARPILPLDTTCGDSNLAAKAVIREAECIGCTLCIQACPVDAIIGATQLMHSVITSECTGCELCLPPCPVDCIDIIAPPERVPTTQILPAQACIRCGLCEPACPKQLAPQELYWYRESVTALDALDLDACIECRLCDRVCPSNIALTETFKRAKQAKAIHLEQNDRAEHLDLRFERHQSRLASTQQKVRERPSRNEASSLLDAIKQQQES